MANILYIEDYPAAALTMEYLLAEFGHHCTVAATGGDAVERVRERPFDLVLIDNKLPDMTGAAVAKAIRKVEQELGRTQGTLVGYSAGTPPTEDYNAANMNGFEMKSLSMAHLGAMLNKYLPPVAE